MESIMELFDALNAYHRGKSTFKKVYDFAIQNTCEIPNTHPERELKKDITGLLDHVIEHEEVPESLGRPDRGIRFLVVQPQSLQYRAGSKIEPGSKRAKHDGTKTERGYRIYQDGRFFYENPRCLKNKGWVECKTSQDQVCRKDE